MKIILRTTLSILSLLSLTWLAFVPAGAASAATASHARHLPGPHLMRPMLKTGTASVIDGQLIDHGGPVQTAPQVYVVFWDWTSDPSGEQPYLENFLSSVGGTPWLSTVGQYGAGSSGSLLKGTWSDPSPIPASPSDSDIRAEAVSAANHFGVGTSVNVQIVVATPTGHSSPGFPSSFCAYHGALTNDPDVTFTNLPYQTDAAKTEGTGGCFEDSVNGPNGTLDGVSIVEGHELAETITDPLLNAWSDASGNEIGDKCEGDTLTDITASADTFAVQPLWSNNDNGCVNSPGHPASPIALEYDTSDPAPAATQIGANFNLINEGNTPINLSGITVRYWFTEDGTQPISFACDYAPIGCFNITSDFHTTSLGGQDHYLEFGFTSGAGTLQPGQSTGLIETRFYQHNFATMNQANDWSFNGADTTPNPNPHITVYQNGNLLTGQEP